jgi:soluble lytic murein transglycosylase-like protein
MRLHPIFAIFGVLLGSCLVALLGFVVMSGVSLPQPALAAGPQDVAELGLLPPLEVPAAAAAADAPTGMLEDIATAEDADGPFVAVDHITADAAECALDGHYAAKVTRWCGLISHYADKHDLSPDLIAALIVQESGGDEDAYSHNGAVGLMQVMPSDGPAASFQCINGPCFASRPTTAELQDPEFNVAYGTRMLAQLIRRTGSTREALKSYGPMSVGYSYADTVMAIMDRAVGE